MLISEQYTEEKLISSDFIPITPEAIISELKPSISFIQESLSDEPIFVKSPVEQISATIEDAPINDTIAVNSGNRKSVQRSNSHSSKTAIKYPADLQGLKQIPKVPATDIDTAIIDPVRRALASDPIYGLLTPTVSRLFG